MILRKVHNKLKQKTSYKWSFFKLWWSINILHTHELLYIIGNYTNNILETKQTIKIILLGNIINKSYLISNYYIDIASISKGKLLNLFLTEFETLKFKKFTEIIFPVKYYNKDLINLLEDTLDFETDLDMNLLNHFNSKTEDIIYFNKKL